MSTTGDGSNLVKLADLSMIKNAGKESNLRERDIENYLVRKIASLGGKSYKFSSPSNRAVPDRICFFPYGIINLVECKAPGKTVTQMQAKVIKFLRHLEAEVLVVDTKEKVDIYINIMKEKINEFAKSK